MNSKRPDVRLDDASEEEEGLVTARERGETSRSLVDRLRGLLRR